MAPVVLSELLGDPKLPSQVATSLAGLPLIQTTAGYWQRAGLLRAKVPAALTQTTQAVGMRTYFPWGMQSRPIVLGG